jgi:hypothetical protein
LFKIGLAFFIFGLGSLTADVFSDWTLFSAWINGKESSFQVSEKAFTDPNQGFRANGPELFIHHTSPPTGILVYSQKLLPAQTTVECRLSGNICFSNTYSTLSFLNQSVVTGIYLHILLLVFGVGFIGAHFLRRKPSPNNPL